jgi:hypothetical protein
MNTLGFCPTSVLTAGDSHEPSSTAQREPKQYRITRFDPPAHRSYEKSRIRLILSGVVH